MSSDLQIGKGLLNTPLSMEMYQRIHATALQRTFRGLHLRAVPDHVDVEQLKQLVARIGFDGCLTHPSDVERIFAGVSLETYQTIRGLYCSRLGRSISMVYRILQMLCQQERAPIPTYEAVWAICLYLEKRRRESVDVSVERTTEAWWIGKLSPAVRIQVEKDAFYLPGIVCMIDTRTQHVLSFTIAPVDTLAESIPLALYDALIAQRRPHPLALAGVLWHLPRRIVTEEALPRACSTICRRMGIQVETHGQRASPGASSRRATAQRYSIVSSAGCTDMDRCARANSAIKHLPRPRAITRTRPRSFPCSARCSLSREESSPKMAL